jgi:hypothetical protein
MPFDWECNSGTGGGAGGGVGALLPEEDGGGGCGGAEGTRDARGGNPEGGGGAGEMFVGIRKDPLERRFAELGIGGGLAGTGAGDSLALFAAAVTRRLTMLEAGRTCWRLSETLRGTRGVAPDCRRGAMFEVPDSGECGGGARPRGMGTGRLPLPTIVDGRFGDSPELVRGRAGTFRDTVEVGRSAARWLAMRLKLKTHLPY